MKSKGCKDCKERHLHCHSHCERYKEYKEELERAKQYLKEQSEFDNRFSY